MSPDAIKGEPDAPVRGLELKRKRSDGLDSSSTSPEPLDVDATFAHSTRQASSTLHDTSLQNVHQPILSTDGDRNQQQRKGWSTEVTVPIAEGRTQAYCDWWRKEAGRDGLSLFCVRLIGDASSPEAFTAMAHTDLAYFR